ncbi:MAG: hypothetical protein ACOCSN_04335 [Halanaeroarchaeum sp.]
MRLQSVLGLLATFGIVVWTLEAVLALPGALAVSGGASIVLGLLILAVAAVVGIGMTTSRSRTTTYW